MTKIAIIPARGGSKRIPRKNIKDFLGKPIIAYSIGAALKSELFDEVMVSTDDKEIAEVAQRYGAKVPFMRSKKNADDFATTTDVLLEVLEEYKKRDREFVYLCCIYPTAPFVTEEKLQHSFNLMVEKNADSVIPVVRFSHPIQRALRIKENKNLEYIYPENMNKRSQDLEPAYHDAGQFYWIKIKSFLKNKFLITSKTVPFVTSEMEAQDIDNEIDWEMAKIKYKLVNEKDEK
ncbi:pseudaminic acid cytidylyltransferase [Calditrichota bacterium GD2]